MPYIIGIDQSTQGTKVILFDEKGDICHKVYRTHQQLINEQGWVSHNPNEIYNNVLGLVNQLLEESDVEQEDLVAVGITNQRETSLIWDKESGQPLDQAVVWQCARAESLVQKMTAEEAAYIKEVTGLGLSPYFSAAKLAFLLKENQPKQPVCCGTIDSWLVYRLTNGESFKTDFSNASRTQLLNLRTLDWDPELLRIFGISREMLPDLTASDACFGHTDFQGLLSKKIPIHAVMGDSHAALYAQNGCQKGDLKVTYGTGSSIMMNIGDHIPDKLESLSISVGWKTVNSWCYVLEGNVHYTGATISWLINELGLVSHIEEVERLARAANPEDSTIMIPAFTGLGAPYWRQDVRAALVGMTRRTGKAEIVKAALESIAYQIDAVLRTMAIESGISIGTVNVDGGPTKNQFLMQFQSNLSDKVLSLSLIEEASCLGVVYMAGLAIGLFDDTILSKVEKRQIFPDMDPEDRRHRQERWDREVAKLLA